MPVEHGSVKFIPAAVTVLDPLNNGFYDFILSYQQQLRHPIPHVRPTYIYGRIRLTAALPPAARMSMPHFAARGCVQATIPLVLCTTLLLLGNLTGTCDGGGKTEGVVRGILDKEDEDDVDKGQSKYNTNESTRSVPASVA